MSGAVVLDTGALIALERGDPRLRALVRLAGHGGRRLVIPPTVLAQAWRGGARSARLAALLQADYVDVPPFGRAEARGVGELLAASGTADVVDAAVVIAARLRGAPVVSSDADDLRRLDPALEVVGV